MKASFFGYQVIHSSPGALPGRCMKEVRQFLVLRFFIRLAIGDDVGKGKNSGDELCCLTILFLDRDQRKTESPDPIGNPVRSCQEITLAVGPATVRPEVSKGERPGHASIPQHDRIS
jgi:hypothetical protein